MIVMMAVVIIVINIVIMIVIMAVVVIVIIIVIMIVMMAVVIIVIRQLSYMSLQGITHAPHMPPHAAFRRA